MKVSIGYKVKQNVSHILAVCALVKKWYILPYPTAMCTGERVVQSVCHILPACASALKQHQMSVPYPSAVFTS